MNAAKSRRPTCVGSARAHQLRTRAPPLAAYLHRVDKHVNRMHCRCGAPVVPEPFRDTTDADCAVAAKRARLL